MVLVNQNLLKIIIRLTILSWKLLFMLWNLVLLFKELNLKSIFVRKV